MWRGVDVSHPVGDFSVAEFDELLFALQKDGFLDFAFDALDGATFGAHEPVGHHFVRVVKVEDVMVDNACYGGEGEWIEQEQFSRRIFCISSICSVML